MNIFIITIKLMIVIEIETKFEIKAILETVMLIHNVIMKYYLYYFISLHLFYLFS